MAIRKLRTTDASGNAPSAADLDAAAEEQKMEDATAGMTVDDAQELVDYLVAHGHSEEEAQTFVAQHPESIRLAVKGHTAPAPVPPPTTPAAHPPKTEQPGTEQAAPASRQGPASFQAPGPGVNWTDPKLDTTKKDSMGNEKLDQGTFGPKGKSVPPDVQTEVERQAAADAKEAKLAKGMASTAGVDSVGKPKGAFKTISQGVDKHGAKIPDKVDYSQPLEKPVHAGPRGKGAPKDTYRAK